MRIYISGPMRGYPQDNHPAFHAAKAKLEAEGHEVISPADLDVNLPALTTPRQYAQRDTAEVLKCEAIYMLRGWTRSRGAACEFFTARFADMQVFCENKSQNPLEDFAYDNLIKAF